MKTILALLFVVLPLIGMADAGYITYEKYSGQIPACGSGFDCGSVLTSKWASIGPVPLSVLGLLFYAVVFILGVAHFLAVRPFGKPSTILKKLQGKPLTPISTFALISPFEFLVIATTFGALFSLYLVFLMGFVIQAWCFYCLISAVTSFTLFIVMFTTVTVFKPSLAGLRLWIASCISWKYQHILKPFFFMLDAEVIHESMTKVGETLGSFAVTRWLTRVAFGYSDPRLARTFDGITFPAPVGLAAGFDYNGKLTQILPSLGFGFHTIGTVTLEPYAGNPQPRLGRFPESKGLLVNKGLKSLGAPTIAHNLAQVTLQIPTGISIASTNKLFASTKEQLLDFLSTFIIFEKSAVKHHYYELNISCPNTFGGEPFTSPERLEMLLTLLDRLRITRPIYIKMPIDQADSISLQLLETAAQHTIAGVIFGNLTKDKNNPAVTANDRALWEKSKGNVSGKPTWERSNHLLALVAEHFPGRFTLIGTGGIFSPADVTTKQELGADLCQVITGMIFQGPQLIGQIHAWKSLQQTHKLH